MIDATLFWPTPHLINLHRTTSKVLTNKTRYLYPTSASNPCKVTNRSQSEPSASIPRFPHVLQRLRNHLHSNPTLLQGPPKARRATRQAPAPWLTRHCLREPATAIDTISQPALGKAINAWIPRWLLEAPITTAPSSLRWMMPFQPESLYRDHRARRRSLYRVHSKARDEDCLRRKAHIASQIKQIKERESWDFDSLVATAVGITSSTVDSVKHP